MQNVHLLYGTHRRLAVPFSLYMTQRALDLEVVGGITLRFAERSH